MLPVLKASPVMAVAERNSDPALVCETSGWRDTKEVHAAVFPTPDMPNTITVPILEKSWLLKGWGPLRSNIHE
jgi:hypothetical protein